MNSGGELRGAAVPHRTRTDLIAFAVPNLDEPYFAELTTLLVRRANERGLSVLIQQTEGDHDRELEVANGVGLPPTDGLIHIPRSLRVSDLTRRSSPGPLVLLGEHIQNSPFTHITIDNREAAASATRHLAERGRRQIAFIGPRDARPSDAADKRFAGYRDAVSAHNLSTDPRLVVQVMAFTSEEGHRAARELIGSGVEFDAVCCSNDSIAFGVISALHTAGIPVPDQVGVIGIDDVQAGRYSVPSLSTVAPDRLTMVDTALDELERQIAAPTGADLPVKQFVVSTKVIARGSSAERR